MLDKSKDKVEDEEDDDDKVLSEEEKQQVDAFIDVVTGEDDNFYKKWGPPVILGGFLPAVLSLIIIFTGQLVLNTWTGTCGYALPSFISAAIAVCYLYLLVYSWIFIGTKVSFHIPFVGLRTVALPFTSLKWVMMFYLLLGLASFITWCVGTTLYNLAYFCATTSPGLYSYVFFLVVIYWLFFSIVALYMIQIFFGSKIGAFVRETTRESTLEEAEIAVFTTKFSNFDPENSKAMNSEDFKPFLRELGIFVPEEEIEGLLRTFDTEGNNTLKFDPMLEWFRKFLADREAEAAEEKPSDLDAEELEIYHAEKARQLEEKQKKKI